MNRGIWRRRIPTPRHDCSRYPFYAQHPPCPLQASTLPCRTRTRRFLHGSTAASPHGAPDGDTFDPYTYTSGRWLGGDAVERASRFVQFNFDALCGRIIELCRGARSIVSCDKVEGGFNRVFVFRTDNAQRIVARLPFGLAGPLALRTSSEVATIKYLQAKTSVPIPEILDWSDDASNIIGSEYIIMEHAHGIPLHQAWPAMDLSDQIYCIKAIFQNLKQVADLEFPGYGSLYFDDTPYITASKLPLDREFCIGPHCGTRYWNSNANQPRFYHRASPNQGPWPTFMAYCDGLVDAGVSRIPQTAAGGLKRRPRYHGSIETHHALLEQGREVMKKMATDSRLTTAKAASPLLFHPDLHKRNIFVSEDNPRIITAMIDWQSASIEPAFWHADEVPDFAQPLLPDSSHEDQPEPKSEACAKAHDLCLRFCAPKIAEARSMDEALFRPFRYAYRTWQDGAVAFREELLQTARSWQALGLPGSCPFALPSPADLAVHRSEYRRFEAAHQLKRMLASLLACASDGWVAAEHWEAAVSAHKELFRGILQEVLDNDVSDDEEEEPIRDEADLREIWPFDLEE